MHSCDYVIIIVYAIFSFMNGYETTIIYTFVQNKLAFQGKHHLIERTSTLVGIGNQVRIQLFDNICVLTSLQIKVGATIGTLLTFVLIMTGSMT
jgi:hypothetical protein